MKSQYKDLRFPSKEKFEKWLSKLATRKIHFKSEGQDLTEIWIDKHGEILHCDMQGGVWNGLFVRTHPAVFKAGMPIEMNLPNKGWRTMDFIIEKITKLK